MKLMKMDKLLESIVKDVQVLDINWFKKKVDYFRKEPFYDRAGDRIYTVVEQKELLVDDNYEIEELIRETKIDKDLPQYCWNSLFYGSLIRDCYEYDQDLSDFPVDGSTISWSITSKVQEHIEEFTDLNSSYKLISYVLSNVKTTIESNPDFKEDDEYRRALLYFLKNFQDSIVEYFAPIQNQIELLDVHEYLDFNLGQEELAALLLILNKAGFINTSGYNDTTFLRFCQRYFRFKKKSMYVSPSTLKSFTDKYREFSRDEYSKKALNHIKEGLTKAIKDT